MIPNYRAWHKLRKQMFEVTRLLWSAAQPGVLEEMSIIALDDTYQVVSVYGSETITNNYVLMQSTRLKDKNGADIYEGDIVTIKGLGNAEVVMNEGQWETYLEDSPEMGGSLYGWLCPLLVVGNIYQHDHRIREEPS